MFDLFLNGQVIQLTQEPSVSAFSTRKCPSDHFSSKFEEGGLFWGPWSGGLKKAVGLSNLKKKTFGATSFLLLLRERPADE